MAEWFQTFDDARVLERARTGIRRLVIAFALVSGILVAGAPLATVAWRAQPGLVALLCGSVLSVLATAVLIRLTRESERLWRIELSAHHAIGHDTAGRRVVLPWSRVVRVDLTTEGVDVIGTDTVGRPLRLRASASMPTFSTFAHRIVEVAEARGCAVCIDGCPIADLDLAALLPILCETGTTPA